MRDVSSVDGNDFPDPTKDISFIYKLKFLNMRPFVFETTFGLSLEIGKLPATLANMF